MKNQIIAFVLGIIWSSAAIAQEKDPKITEVTFTVQGVCDMCESRIEKAASYVKGVKRAEWNLEKQEITVIFRNDKTTQQAIEQAIADTGYDTQNIKAKDEVYNTLHHCCRYRDLTKH